MHCESTAEEGRFGWSHDKILLSTESEIRAVHPITNCVTN